MSFGTAGLSGSFSGLSLITSALTGVGKVASGFGQSKVDDYNAEITLENMRTQMIANQQSYSARIGKQAAAYAASGVDIQSGSPLMVMAATAASGAEEGEQIKEAGEEKAAYQRYQAKMSAYSGIMGGIGSFLSGISNAYQAKPKSTGTLEGTEG